MGNRDIGLLLCGFLAGATFGVASGLLTAPHSGRMTRRMIRRRGEDVQDRLTEAADEMLERGRELMDLGRELVDERTRPISKSLREATGRAS